MNDITIILLTPNKVPSEWAAYHKSVLMEAIEDTPIITISNKPMKWGINLRQRSYGYVNIYRQILRGAKRAKTPYIAIAEDDTLYPKEHFMYRPPLDTFAYNMNRWGILPWRKPAFFFLKQSYANGNLIAPRLLVIEALEERFKNGMTEELCGELGKKRIEKKLGVTIRRSCEFVTKEPVLFFCHDNALDPLERNRKKVPWPIRALEIPTWGKASEIVNKFPIKDRRRHA